MHRATTRSKSPWSLGLRNPIVVAGVVDEASEWSSNEEDEEGWTTSLE